MKNKDLNRLFKVNTVLQTKDGRKIGNAIIISHDDNYNIVKTDYGSECRLTDEEIEKLFHAPYAGLVPTTKHKNAVLTNDNGNAVTSIEERIRLLYGDMHLIAVSTEVILDVFTFILLFKNKHGRTVLFETSEELTTEFLYELFNKEQHEK